MSCCALVASRAPPLVCSMFPVQISVLHKEFLYVQKMIKLSEEQTLGRLRGGSVTSSSSC